MSRRLGVGIVEQVLHAQKDLLDRNGWLPRLLFVQDRQANSSGGIHVRVEERGDEFAYRMSVSRPIACLMHRVSHHLHFGGLVGYSAIEENVSQHFDYHPYT